MNHKRTSVRPKIKRIKSNKVFVKRPIFLIPLSCVILVVAVYCFTLFSSYFKVTHIQISGYKTISSHDIEKIVSDYLGSSKLFGSLGDHPKSIFSVNTHKISQDIKNSFPVVKSVTVQKKLPNVVAVSVDERDTFGVFCQQDNTCFTVDKSGVIYQQLQSVPDGNIVISNDSKDQNYSLGGSVAREDEISMISSINDNLNNNFQIKVVKATVGNPLVVTTSEGWQAYFDPTQDIYLQITEMNYLLSDQITDKKRQNLQYIYLQYKGKAYYK